MRTNQFKIQSTILGFIAFGLLAAGCGKEPVSDGCIRLFAEKMTAAGNAKVLFDPAHLNAAEWVSGERLDINGSTYTIGGDANSGYSVDGNAITGSSLYAIYPATVKDALGNDMAVTNGGTGNCAVDIRALAINLHGDGRHDVYFPMAATATGDATEMTFRHLTGGLKLTLTAASGASVDRIVVTATKADGCSPAIYRDIAPEWAGGLLPALPIEHGQEGDQSAQFISDMTLIMNQGGSRGVTITSSGITFCIPMLAQQLMHLTVTGYNGSSTEPVFSKTKTLNTATDIERNKMYNIPAISIN